MPISKNPKTNDENTLFHTGIVHDTPLSPSSAIAIKFEQGRDAFNFKKYAEAFEHSDAVVHAIRDQYINALELRASALGRMANFKAATNDVKTIIHIAPSSPVGYLCHGELFSMRGNQRQAIQVYNEGLLHMKTEEDRAKLKHARAFAINKRNKRFDIFSKLPYDMIHIILSYLDIQKRFRILDVSKAWHDRVSGCSSVWSKLIVSKHTRLSSSIAKEISLITVVSHHVKSLTLMDLQDTSFFEAVLSLMENGSFTRLEELFINTCLIPSTQKLVNALSRTASTLKDIILATNYRDNKMSLPLEIPLNTLLIICPNLQSLNQNYIGSIKFEEEKSVVTAGGSYYDPRTPFINKALTTLQLGFEHVGIADLKWIYDTCPRLCRLIIFGCQSTTLNKIYGLFQKRVERLCFGINLYEVYNNDDNKDRVEYHGSSTGISSEIQNTSNTITTTVNNTKKAFTGILEVAVRIDNPSNFISLFKNECTMMRTLRLQIHLPWDLTREEERTEWQSLLTNISHFNNLRLLDICRVNDRICSSVIVPLLQKAPNLHQLRFYTPSTLVGQEVMTTIANIQYLQKLEISECSSTDQDMQTLFRALAAKGNASTLEHLCIIYNDHFSMDGIVDAIAAISSLRYIELEAVDGLTEKGMGLLCKKLKDHSCIRSIKLSHLDYCVDDTTLQALAEIKRLDCLHLVGLYKITRAGLNVFTGTSVKLNIKSCKLK
ncbi:hypothetical protein BDA99DRAFT_525719 [Phascolomyces articulosus]|uniref:F-box domain-containing protein n=1 Tax=Phascolomyces articulosus TaxID=60185 RepID=A0AAD5JNR8_9FUNG|nr:hypothetical protein BDA99DRAFT_525719 [Phascolomyces articulosus]